MWKADLSDCENSAVCDTPDEWWKILAVKKMTIAIVRDGTVVTIIYLIWVNRGVPVEDEASTVVSERGDTLSPK